MESTKIVLEYQRLMLSDASLPVIIKPRDRNQDYIFGLLTKMIPGFRHLNGPDCLLF
jgi:hypothetical protein